MWVFLFNRGNFRISLILLCILYFLQFVQSKAIFLIHLNAHQLQPIRAPEALVIPLIHHPRFSHERDKRLGATKKMWTFAKSYFRKGQTYSKKSLIMFTLYGIDYRWVTLVRLSKNLDLMPVFKVEKFLLNPSIQLGKF